MMFGLPDCAYAFDLAGAWATSADQCGKVFARKGRADAWEPLYKTLSDDQKRRMAFVSFAVMRGMRDAIEHDDEPEDEDE
nr:hypothetical protein G6P99_42180 [Bradyrhizobium sp. 6(2017)]